VPLFRRKKGDPEADGNEGSGKDLDGQEPAATYVESEGEEPDTTSELERGFGLPGPWDVSEAPEDDDRPRVDIGGLLVPGFPGLELRLEVDRASERVIAATAVVGDGQLQIQPFAAPRSGGLWDDVRAEIIQGIGEAGGKVQEVSGRFGAELIAEVPADDGSPGLQPARFVGIDGPRWFLRGVYSGSAARPGKSADRLDEVLATTIVNRGDAAMAPRDLLPLHLPNEGQPLPAPPDTAPHLDALRKRGPEITEIH
jgi:hypothetical protein